jgi:hypothetical protein
MLCSGCDNPRLFVFPSISQLMVCTFEKSIPETQYTSSSLIILMTNLLFGVACFKASRDLQEVFKGSYRSLVAPLHLQYLIPAECEHAAGVD